MIKDGAGMDQENLNRVVADKAKNTLEHPGDVIYINELKLESRVGVYEWEQKIKQPLHIDLVVLLDLQPAGIADDLSASVDYATIAEEIQTIALAKHYKLIEHLAETLCKHLLANQKIQQVTITVHKPYAIPHASKVGVRLTRSKTSCIN